MRSSPAWIVSSYNGDWSTTNEPADWANARTIFLWGYNLTEAHIHNWHLVADAIENGAKLIVIGPVFTQSGPRPTSSCRSVPAPTRR